MPGPFNLLQLIKWHFFFTGVILSVLTFPLQIAMIVIGKFMNSPGTYLWQVSTFTNPRDLRSCTK